MSQAGKLWQGAAASARLANAPSVLCNVAAGLIYGDAQLSDPAAVLALLAALALYHGGCFLNDWFDRGWDAKYRPKRPLPSGLIPPQRYQILAGALLCSGCLSAFAADRNAGIIALAIAALVILYTVIHKRSAWSVLPMGLCRALLPAMGLAASGGSPFQAIAILAGLGLLLHVAGISWLARAESKHAHGRRSSIFSACFAAAALTPIAGGILLLGFDWSFVLLAAVPYLAWTGLAIGSTRLSTAARVSMLLAGIPWIDWILLLPFSHAGASSPVIALGLPPMMWLLGRLAQRVSPAT